MERYQLDPEIEKAANEARGKQAIITVVFIVCLLAFALHFGYSEETYQVEMEADRNDGYNWSCEIDDESILGIRNSYYATGLFVFTFEGVGKGNTDVTFRLTKDEDPTVLQEQVYHVSVDRRNRVTFAGLEKRKNPFIPEEESASASNAGSEAGSDAE